MKAKFECRKCHRRFGSLAAFDAHLGSDAALLRGEGHTDPKNTTTRQWVLDQHGIWRSPGESNPYGSQGILEGLD